MSRRLRVMLVAVEASADTLGAGLAHALNAKLGAGVELFGVGGAKMAAEGIVSPYEIGDLSLVGLFEIAGAVPLALRRLQETVRLAETAQPDIAVLIDSWEFTWRVGRRMRLRTPAVALIKYVAPQVWATRPGRVRVVARIFDRLMTLFDFETRYFEAEGVRTTSVGNPALRRYLSTADPARLRAMIGAGSDDPILLVLPGSRPGEIKRVLPAFAGAVQRLTAARPDLRIVVAAADTVADQVKARVATWRRPAYVVEGELDKLDAMRAATVALACSGTVTTELAVAGCPMVVGYRGHPATAIVARAIIRTRYFTLFNIAADAPIAPEFLQARCNGRDLASAVGALLDDPTKRAAQAEAQTAALAKLGLNRSDPFEAAASVVIDLARERGLLDA